MLRGATAALGAGLEEGGTKLVEYAGNGTEIKELALKRIGNVAQTVGPGMFLGGKVVAYSILVPAYTIGYVAPKWLVTEGLPKGYEIGRDYVVIPIVNGVIAGAEYAGTKIGEAAVLVNDYVIQPTIRGISNTVEYSGNVASEIGRSVMDQGAKASTLANKTYEYVSNDIYSFFHRNFAQS